MLVRWVAGSIRYMVNSAKPITKLILGLPLEKKTQIFLAAMSSSRSDNVTHVSVCLYVHALFLEQCYSVSNDVKDILEKVSDDGDDNDNDNNDDDDNHDHNDDNDDDR